MVQAGNKTERWTEGREREIIIIMRRGEPNNLLSQSGPRAVLTTDTALGPGPVLLMKAGRWDHLDLQLIEL